MSELSELTPIEPCLSEARPARGALVRDSKELDEVCRRVLAAELGYEHACRVCETSMVDAVLLCVAFIFEGRAHVSGDERRLLRAAISRYCRGDML